MKATSPSFHVRINTDALVLRFFDILPGLFSWGTLLALLLLAFRAPVWVAVFLILYDLYWLIRAVYISIHLLASYGVLREHDGIPWNERLQDIQDPKKAKEKIEAEYGHIEERLLQSTTRKEKRLLERNRTQLRMFLTDLESLLQRPRTLPKAEELLHVVIIPTYNEPFSVLRSTLDCLAASDIPKKQLWVVVACEERAGAMAKETQREVMETYADTFGKLLTTLHPDGIRGEKKVKSANATWAAKQVQTLLDAEGVPYERVLISNFDSDTCAPPQYFSYLSYTYILTPDRTHASYQPLPLYHNNIWQAPAFTRVIATNSAFWQMIEATRPDRLVTFSSHSMSFQALVDVGFWAVDIVSEDSRIFWQCFLHYNGRYETIPLFVNVSMDATQSNTLWKTFVNQYKQKRRWAWGIENFPFLALAFLHRPDIPLRKRLRPLWIILEGNHSWATSALIIAILGWIPVLFGNAQFHQTVIALNLPFVTRTLMTLAMGGLVITMSLTLLLLPPAPADTPKRKYMYMVLQWALVPLIASVLGSLPALDAQTRLMIGRPLGFWVTEKVRPSDTEEQP